MVPAATANAPVSGDDGTGAVEVTDLLPVRFSVTDCSFYCSLVGREC